MPSKQNQIIDLLPATELTNREIAEAVGCLPAYVRVVRQRLAGGGQAPADKKWQEAYRATHGVHRCAHKCRTDPAFRAKHNAYRRRNTNLEKA